jgi:hypothetical protein
VFAASGAAVLLCSLTAIVAFLQSDLTPYLLVGSVAVT